MLLSLELHTLTSGAILGIINGYIYMMYGLYVLASFLLSLFL